MATENNRTFALKNLQACLSCGRETSLGTSGEAEPRAPGPGDVSICIGCGHLMIFDERTNVQELTPEQDAALRASPGWPGVCRMRLAISLSRMRLVVVVDPGKQRPGKESGL